MSKSVLSDEAKQAINKIKTSYIHKSVSELKDEQETLHFDLAIQRNEVWTHDQKSLLIHSMIYGYPVPALYALETDDGHLWFLDGKQRLKSAVLKFIDDGYPLSEVTPPIGDFELAGLYWSQLPVEIQKAILNYKFTIFNYKNMDDDDRDETFTRLNSGSPLTKIELIRAIASSKVMEFVKHISNEKFFAETIALNESGRNRFVDEELILQIMLLIHNNGESADFSSKAIKAFAEQLSEQGLDEEFKEKIRITTKYLNDAFPVKEKFLKKIHVPMIFVMATKALESGIEATKFAGWVQDFFVRLMPGSEYSKAASQGSAKKEKVQKRIEEMEKDFTKNINNAPEYKMPEPKVSTGKRGRKPKNQVIEVQSDTNSEGQSA